MISPYEIHPSDGFVDQSWVLPRRTTMSCWRDNAVKDSSRALVRMLRKSMDHLVILMIINMIILLSYTVVVNVYIYMYN